VHRARRYAAGETFRDWLDRSGGASSVAAELAELDAFPPFEDDPDAYVDYGETGPFAVEVGVSECAT